MTEVSEKDLISLKEASKVSGYSADYIGQLIRAGKIPGKQVYCNVQWMTTEEAVMDYKNNGKKGANEKGGLKSSFRQIGMQINILKLFFKTFKTALPIFLLIIVLSSVLFGYLVYSLTNVKVSEVEKKTPFNNMTF